jgi:proliferating cell nuclear antigen PCNA
MNFTLNNPELFKKTISSMKDISEDGSLIFDQKGMHFQLLDSAHIALCTGSMTNDMFDEYNCIVDINIGVNLTMLSKILSMVNKKDKLKCSLKDGNSEELHIECIGETHQNYKMTLMDIDSEKMVIPDIEYTFVYEINSKEFKQNIMDMKKLQANTILFCLSDNSIYLSTKVDSLNLNRKLNYQNLQEHKSITQELSFNALYISIFTSSTSISETVKIHFLEGQPIKISYNFINYYLAPKGCDD